MKLKFLILLVVAAISGCANTKHQTVGGAVDAMLGSVSETGTKARGGLIKILGGHIVVDEERKDSFDNNNSLLRDLGITVQNRGDHSALILSGSAFATGSSTIEPRYKAAIVELAETLKQTRGKIEVTGHTDNVGNQSSNVNLSQRRAISVAKALVGNGVEKSRIAVFGAGPAQPIANNTTYEGRAQNRRVEITVQNETARAFR